MNSNDLTYRYKGNTADAKFDNALNIINKIQDGEIKLEDVKYNKKKIKSYLGEINKGKKSKEQRNTVQY